MTSIFIIFFVPLKVSTNHSKIWFKIITIRIRTHISSNFYTYLFEHILTYYFLTNISGYFTHVTTLGEVKEQVLKYIPVMARPMVMYRDKHPIVWTGVYADIEVIFFLIISQYGPI